MPSGHVSLTNEQQTLLVTLYARVLDHQAADPILGDHRAAEALTQLGRPLGRMRMRRDTAASVLCRTRRLDEWTRQFLAEHPDAVVLNLGCGLDTRAQRIDPPSGVLWYDVDYPEVIELRQRLYPSLPDSAMIGSSVTDPHWLDHVPRDRPTMVTAEGLLMYLTEDQVEKLIGRLAEHLVSGRLACDIELPWAAKVAKYNPKLRTTGAVHRWGLKDLNHLTRWAPGMRLLEQHGLTTLAGMEKVSPLYRYLTTAINLVPSLRDAMRVALYEF